MRSPLKNEEGAVLIIELVVLAVVLAAAAFAGYQYVAHKNTANKAAIPKPHAAVKASPSSTASPDPTSNWTKYSSVSGKYSLRYSPSWKMFSYAGYAASGCQKNRPDSMIDFDTQQSGHTVITGCGGENPGQVHIDSRVGAQDLSATFGNGDPSLYKDVQSKKVTVNGVEGMWYSAVTIQSVLQTVKGAKYFEYHFYANGRNYSFVLVLNPTDKDASSDFDLMVKNTLKFSN